ncbi:MAG: hypothetical protein PHD97_07860 [Bacteroidales bacterium]|nr:hypothetical protein [Bacteroidales bacterium]
MCQFENFKKSGIIFFLFAFLLKANFCFSSDINKNKKDTTQKLSGFYMGVSLGGYFANKNTANFYNGHGLNNLKAAIIDNGYTYVAIRQKLNNKDYSVDTNSLPMNMKYETAINIGFHIRSVYKNNFSVFIESYYSKLKASDYFIIQVADNPQQISQPVLRKYPIVGVEERFDFNLGVSKTLTRKKVNPYVELGVNMNNVKILKSEVQIEDLTYSIVNYKYAYNSINQGGIGFGMFGGTGLEMIFNNKLFINIGVNCCYKKVNIINYNYESHFNTIVYMKLILSGLLFLGENEN